MGRRAVTVTPDMAEFMLDYLQQWVPVMRDPETVEKLSRQMPQ